MFPLKQNVDRGSHLTEYSGAELSISQCEDPSYAQHCHGHAEHDAGREGSQSSRANTSVSESLSIHLFIRDTCQRYEPLNTQSKNMLENLLYGSFNTSRSRADSESWPRWISTVESERKHPYISRPRVKGTGVWFTEHPSFQRWRDQLSVGAEHGLWAYGGPGQENPSLRRISSERYLDLADYIKITCGRSPP